MKSATYLWCPLILRVVGGWELSPPVPPNLPPPIPAPLKPEFIPLSYGDRQWAMFPVLRISCCGPGRRPSPTSSSCVAWMWGRVCSSSCLASVTQKSHRRNMSYRQDPFKCDWGSCTCFCLQPYSTRFLKECWPHLSFLLEFFQSFF